MARGNVNVIMIIYLAIGSIFKLCKGDGTLRGIYIFGDSTADVGTNNNFINCSELAKANHPYNGIDYPFSIPTGRFSNGYNTIDFIVRELGDYRESPLPFLTLLSRNQTFKRELLRGANFASGGAGIQHQTGHDRFGKVIPLSEQIQQFGTAQKSITELLGAPKSNIFLSNSIFIFSVGSNDLVEYQFSSSRNVTPEVFINNLTDIYSTYLQELYKLGGRKFGIISVPPVGCCPVERALNGGKCNDEVNEWAVVFYNSMNSMLQNFSSGFPGVVYSLGNTYEMTMNVIDNPRGSGSKFKDVEKACCGDGLSGCNDKGGLCPNRGDHLFWDWVHPTQAGSRLAALTLVYAEGSEYVTPMNFSRLAMS